MNLVPLTRIASIFLIGALFAAPVAAQSAAVGREIFPPAHGKGAIVVVISGAAGTALYRNFSAKLANSGYYTVLVQGSDVMPGWSIHVSQGLANLQAVIASAKSAPTAIPGKVALVGLSRGGAAALFHGGPLKDEVSAIVAFYPNLTSLDSQLDMKALAARLQVPVLVLAGAKDTYIDCCLIETARLLDAAPKTMSFELVVYPDAGHGFNLDDARFVYREQDATDAWTRTLAFLNRLHPPGGE